VTLHTEAPATGQSSNVLSWPFGSMSSVLGFAVLVAIQVLVSVAMADDPLPVVGGLVFTVALLVSFRWTVTGLALIILSQLYVLKGTAEITAGELAYAGLFVATLVGWFLREGRTADGRRLLRSPVGISLIAFMGLCVFSIVLVVVYGTSPLWWFRDLVRFSYLLLFFPIAGAVRTRRDALVVLLCLLSVVLYHAGVTITWYTQAVHSTSAFWQISNQRVAVHEIFATATLVASFAVFLRVRSRAAQITVLLTSFIGLIALGISFTRGYWLAAALACVIVALVLRGPVRRVVAFAAIMLLGVVGVGVAVFSAKFFGIIASMAERASTVTSPLQALSVQERVAETRSVLEMLRSCWMLGRGLGVEVSYMSPIKNFVITRPFLHNAFLFIWLKLGLVGLASFLVFYFRGLRLTVLALARTHSPVIRALLAAGMAVLIAALPLSFTSPQFYDKSSALVLALSLGLAHATLSGRFDRRRTAASAGSEVVHGR